MVEIEGGRVSVISGAELLQLRAKSTSGSVLAQEGPAELISPPKIFIGYIYCNYGAHEHLGGAFANFGSQVGFLCSDCAESDRIDYYALTSDHVRLMAHAVHTANDGGPVLAIKGKTGPPPAHPAGAPHAAWLASQTTWEAGAGSPS